jgi:hypothetical protein
VDGQLSWTGEKKDKQQPAMPASLFFWFRPIITGAQLEEIWAFSLIPLVQHWRRISFESVSMFELILF